MSRSKSLSATYITFQRQGVLIFCRDLKEKIIVSLFISTDKLILLKIIALLSSDKNFLVYIYQLRGKRQEEKNIISCFLKGTSSSAM